MSLVHRKHELYGYRAVSSSSVNISHRVILVENLLVTNSWMKFPNERARKEGVIEEKREKKGR